MLAIEVARKLNSKNVLDVLYSLLCERGVQATSGQITDLSLRLMPYEGGLKRSA